VTKHLSKYFIIPDSGVTRGKTGALAPGVDYETLKIPYKEAPLFTGAQKS